MGRPLDEMSFYVLRRPGAWDGSWVPVAPALTVAVDGDPTPKSTATIDDVSIFTATEYAQFYDSAGAILGVAQIVSINVPGKVITFATDSLTWDAEVGDLVRPVFVLKAGRPQPLTPELLDFLDEGARTTARFISYAQDDQPDLVMVESDRADLPADVVQYDSKNYMVTGDTKWSGAPLGHHAYILLEFAPDERVPS